MIATPGEQCLERGEHALRSVCQFVCFALSNCSASESGDATMETPDEEERLWTFSK